MKLRVGIFVVVGLLVAAGGLLAVRHLFPGEDSPPPPPKRAPKARDVTPDAAPPEEPKVRLVGVVGAVERRLGDRPWNLARVGDTLDLEEALRTGKNGSADLQVGDKSRLKVTESTEVTVKEITDTVHRFRLAQGRLSVNYGRKGDRVLRIETPGGAVAETREGRFSVLRTPKAVAVATETGTVDLKAADRMVKVQTGEQALARDGKPPSTAMAIPKRLLLRIAGGPGPHKLTQRFTSVEGRTRPGNRVLVAGREVAVDRGGRFVVRVPLKEGRNRVPVQIQDPSGRRVTRVLEYFVVISNDSIDDIKIRWHKKG